MTPTSHVSRASRRRRARAAYALHKALCQARGGAKVCPEALLDLVGAEAEVDPVKQMKDNSKNRSQVGGD